jgi:hypothetical protein
VRCHAINRNIGAREWQIPDQSGEKDHYQLMLKFKDNSHGSKVKRGVRKGGALSTILFNIILEKAIRNIEINPNGTILSLFSLF